MVVCALPCVCAVVALTFMPESPRFYLEVMLISFNIGLETNINQQASRLLPHRAVFPCQLW